jgi:DNA-binding NarL/FixJ family response regulator
MGNASSSKSHWRGQVRRIRLALLDEPAVVSDLGSHVRDVSRLVAGSPPESSGAGRTECLTVVVGKLDPLRTTGLMTVLRDSGVASVLATGLDAAELTCLARRPGQLVAIMDEKADPPRSSQLDPSTGIVVIAGEPTRPYGMLLSAAGVSCLQSDTSLANILAAVQLTARGGCIFLSGAGGHVERTDPSTGSILTGREIQVLALLSVDTSYAEIALKLSISPETAKKHTRSLLRKLKASSKRELRGLPVQWLNWRCAVELEPGLRRRGGT